MRRGRKLAKSPKSIQPMFQRVYDAKGIAPTRAYIYTLARELTRRGQSRCEIEHTLQFMRPDMGLGIIAIVTIARAVHARGGYPGERLIRGVYHFELHRASRQVGRGTS